MLDNTQYFGEDYQVEKLITVGDFKKAGLEFVDGDRGRTGCGMTPYTFLSGDINRMLLELSLYANDEPTKFAWRTNTGVKPEFKGAIEVKHRDGLVSSESKHIANWEIRDCCGDIMEWRPLIQSQQIEVEPEKPVYTQAMADAGKAPSVGVECIMIDKNLDESHGVVGKVEFKNELGLLFRYKVNNLCDFCEYEESRFKPIDTRTSEQKLRDELANELMKFVNKSTASALVIRLTCKFTITSNNGES